MRRTMKHPDAGSGNTTGHHQSIGALEAAKAVLSRLAGNLKRFNEINLKEYTQVETTPGHAEYPVRMSGSRPS